MVTDPVPSESLSDDRPLKLIAHPVRHLRGTARVPGDKSLSHRAIMLSALAVGKSVISGLLEGEDVLATAAAMRALGATVTRVGAGAWEVHGVGVGGLATPAQALDMGNSGTSTRLLMGLLASHDLTATFVGDASLTRRPMARIIDPITLIGASVSAREERFLPLTLVGTPEPLPIDYSPAVASAQVKSAVLLAGLNTPGTTIVREKVATRDHTERLLTAMGADLRVDRDGENGTGRIIRLAGHAELNPITLSVPGDISSAAFPVVAAAALPGSDILIEGVGVNPLRSGIVDALTAMGADICLENMQTLSGEPVADIRVRGGKLHAIDGVPGDPSRMIDEFPVLFVAAACAHGTSRFTGLAELRVKESDRLSAMAHALAQAGIRVEELEDGLVIHGCGGLVPGGGHVDARLDHRIAMSGAILGLLAEMPVHVDDATPIATSFPDFAALMATLGADIELTGPHSPEPSAYRPVSLNAQNND